MKVKIYIAVILAILLPVLFICCGSSSIKNNYVFPEELPQVIHDTIKYPIIISDTSCKIKNTRLIKINDSLSERLFLANYKIERVKFYLNICLKKPSQDKFLKGWIRRAIND